MLGNCKKENICPDHFPDFNLGSFIIIKSMFIMKNLTDFRKTVETGVNPHLRIDEGERFAFSFMYGNTQKVDSSLLLRLQ